MPSPRPRLLVVDDDRAILTLVGSVALGEGFDVATTVDGADALQQLSTRPADLVLVDLRMPGVTGLEVLKAIRDVNPRSRVVLMSGHATIDSAVTAVKLGAMDYLTKPFDLQRLRQLLSVIRIDTDERRAVLMLEGDVAKHLEFCGMIGRGPAMQDVFELIRRLAPHARTAIVTGETGTGKELAVHALHTLGPRSAKRLVTVNCSAVVETLSESELFGHVRGAFTGAAEAKTGLFETADGATLFLDEVGELPLAVQAKLLRVIENGEVQRVGSVETRKVDVRLIAATNRDLRAEVAIGRFRGDLYYRLNIAEVALPPLRDRREDIPYLTAAFVRSCAQRFGKALSGLTPGAERRLADAQWEGNVRQLRNVIERGCMLADGEFITEANLSTSMTQASTRPAEPVAIQRRDLPAPLIEIEREHIIKTLDQVRGNKAVAARLLGISRRAFYRQLERHGLHHRVPTGSTHRATSPAPLEQAS
ncbi:MAG TPA: sigma-54 dependent transcriptional regulator [Vicinamibacterales bacterium]|nr:sigma-54 dependent transcriptional regulator [Vicinamibacterales bacterium]